MTEATKVTKLYTVRMFERFALDVPVRTYKGVEEPNVEDYEELADEYGWILTKEYAGYVDRRFGRCWYVWSKPNASPYPGAGQDNLPGPSETGNLMY